MKPVSLSDLQIVASLFLDQAKDLWPFCLGGVLFAALIKTYKWDRRIRASLVRHERSAVLVATAAGLVSPLCSCGILPVVIALSAAGVPLPPVLALLISSPLMSPDAFLITVGQLGWTYALWKIAAALAAGLTAGYAAMALQRRGILKGSGFRNGRLRGDDGEARPGFEAIVNAGCFAHPGAPGGVVDRESRLLFFAERFRDMALLVGTYIVPALLLQALVTYYLPSNVVEPLLGRRSALSVLFATLISIPLPLTQVVAPSVVKGLLATGMSPGAGMAILVGGPVASLPAFSALLCAYDRRVFFLYLGIGAGTAFLAGTVFRMYYG